MQVVKGKNSVAVRDKFVGVGFEGDRIDTKVTAEGDKGEGFGLQVIGLKQRFLRNATERWLPGRR